MADYKLTYFNGRGRAEVIRLVFAAAGVKYEDIRFEDDQLPAIKSKTPFGQVPILEFDGKVFCQSYSIARYLARKFKLSGKTDLEELQADMLIDCMEDTFGAIARFSFYENDESRKAAMKKTFTEETLPTSLSHLEKLLKSNKGGDGYFVGDALTWADLGLLSLVGWIEMSGNGAVFDKYPKLKSLNDRVEKLPKIAAWIAKRPATDF